MTGLVWAGVSAGVAWGMGVSAGALFAAVAEAGGVSLGAGRPSRVLCVAGDAVLGVENA